MPWEYSQAGVDYQVRCILGATELEWQCTVNARLG